MGRKVWCKKIVNILLVDFSNVMKSYFSSGRCLLSIAKKVVDHGRPEETGKDLEKRNDRPDHLFNESTAVFLKINR